MIDSRRDDLPYLTDSSPHICLPMYGGRCWCQPRTLLQAMLHASLRATAERLTPDNVVQLPSRRGARAGVG
jgi:hypothetical protein